jgi:DNA mismatch endonuclease (patch repair protein)
MRAVKSKGNKSTELKLIYIFNSCGISGWRRGYPVKGHPDFVFLDFKLAIFVDGCLWHGHTCRHYPKSNEDFWSKKIEWNARHDVEITKRFQDRGWTVLRIWECELIKKNQINIGATLKKLIEWLITERQDKY